MHYPVLEINLKDLQYNAGREIDRLNQAGIELMGVNKVFNGMPETAEAIVKSGIKVVAEVLPCNLIKIKDVPCEKVLLRSPGFSEIPDVIRYADISLVANIETLEALSKEAVRQSKPHKVMLMIDMGDIREGIWFEDRDEIDAAVQKTIELPGLEIYGLGTNFGCYGTVLPSYENTTAFIEIARQLKEKFDIKLRYLSGGNSTSSHLLEEGKMPKEINQLRIGAEYIFGIEYEKEKYLDGYCHSQKNINKYVSNSYILKSEIIELREKPTVPVGELSVDAFMRVKTFTDRGVRKQAILALGMQDVPYENIHPVDERIQILGQTSNHMVIDIEDAKNDYQLGSIIPFEIDYTALMLLCNAASVSKVFID